MNWQSLLNKERISDIYGQKKIKWPNSIPPIPSNESRLPQERDHDRILFATPFRRMGDKTQVFPLRSIESIRTRLTHSYEVANLARSVGLQIAEHYRSKLPDNAIRIIPAMLAAAGLAHDIGNPPFGHQGEAAIRHWFDMNSDILFDPQKSDNHFPGYSSIGVKNDVNKLNKQHKNDFLLFEGNAQTLRMLAKLQHVGDNIGINLTIGTIMSMMKYVVPSDKVDTSETANSAHKKVGFFASEHAMVNKIRELTKIPEDARHPLALVMEACDDISYSVADIEDSIKKGIFSINDLMGFLEHAKEINGNDKFIEYIFKDFYENVKYLQKIRKAEKFDKNEIEDFTTQMFRVRAIHVMISAVFDNFQKNYNLIMSGKFYKGLIEESEANNLCNSLKNFCRDNALKHKDVLEVELNGFNIINQLMNFLWIGISHREVYEDLSSDRKSPFSAYVYSRISKNYRRIFEYKIKQGDSELLSRDLPIRYKEMQLLTDMVSGMTDQFCIDLYNDLKNQYFDMKPLTNNI